MKSIKHVFHILSYLQYPLVAVALYFYTLFALSLAKNTFEWENLNNSLVFYGLSISLSTLQDTTKTQNKFSKKIWEHPKKGKIALILMGLMALLCMIAGTFGLLKSQASIHKEISFGLVVLGIGLVGLVKTAQEMFENHRKDRKIMKN